MTQPGPMDPFGRLPRPENNLGIAGFILSVVGLATCGLLSPVGLIMSLFALRREPKGFAIAGTIIGAVGSCGTIFALVVAFTKVMIVLAALGLGGLAIAIGGANIETQVEMAEIGKEVEIYKQRTGQYPASLDLLPIVDSNALTDAWGNTYSYRLSDDGLTYELVSFGPDKTEATADDISPSEDFTQFHAESEFKVNPQPPAATP